MLLAIAGTSAASRHRDYKWVIVGLVLGTGIGIPLGRVQMTAVPQRTALSHAFGALCVTLVGTAEYYLQAPTCSALHHGGALGGSNSRRPDFHRKLNGRRQAARDFAAAAAHL